MAKPPSYMHITGHHPLVMLTVSDMVSRVFAAMSGAASREWGSKHWKQHVLAVIDGEVVDLDRFCSEGGGKLWNLS